jgi:murein tripeptide amidase MpaA
VGIIVAMKKQYLSYDEAVNFLFEAQKKYPDFIKVESIGKSIENRDIYLATLSLGIKDADKKPALLYTGTIHARESIGIELAIAFIKYNLSHIHYDPRVEHIFQKSTMYIVPCLNPDGFEYSRKHFSLEKKSQSKFRWNHRC